MTPFTTGLTYDGIPLIVSGKRDAEDCWVERVCVAGTQHDLFDALQPGVIERIAELVDSVISRRYQQERADNLRTDYEFERFMRHL